MPLAKRDFRHVPAAVLRGFAPTEKRRLVTATGAPGITRGFIGVDVAVLAVKISEGALYPNLTLTASASQGSYPAFEVVKQTAASVVGTLTVPIYQGGAEYSAIRQSKETLGQQRLNLDVNRD
jgi:outer membrane protein